MHPLSRGVGGFEGDVALDAAGSHSAFAGSCGSPVPGVAWSVRRADVQAVASPDYPHGHVPAQPAVPPPGGKVQFLGLADPVQVL